MAFYTRIVDVAIVAILFLAALLAGKPTMAARQDQDFGTSNPESTSQAILARDNSEFVGLTTVAKVTRQFEMYNPHSKQQLQKLKDMGFTQVILDWPSLHREAAGLGLDVVLANWWTQNTPQADINRAIEIAKQVKHGRLAGISVMDEPETNAPDTPFDYYRNLYDELRPRLDRELPGVRLEISHWGPLSTWDQRYYDYFAILYEAADVMRIMPYPDLDEGPLNEVHFMMLRSRELMKIAGRELPLLVILQTWVLPPKSELPSIDELRVMAYQAMLDGAETLSFFDYNQTVWAETPGFHDDFAGLMMELKQLSNRLAGAAIETSMDEFGVLHAKISWPSGRTTTLLVNTNRICVNNLQPLSIVEFAACEPCAQVPASMCRPAPRYTCTRRSADAMCSAGLARVAPLRRIQSNRCESVQRGWLQPNSIRRFRCHARLRR